MSIFRLPDLGEGLNEAELVAWHVAPGDHVVADQPLVSVETDKSIIDIPSPQAGHVAMLHGEPGDLVAVGAPLVEFAEAGQTHDAGTVVGELKVAPAQHLPQGAPAQDLPQGAATPPSSRANATPAVRALATRLGVNLSDVAGSGPRGSISREDVQAAASRRTTANAASSTGALRGVRRVMARRMSEARNRVTPATLTDTARVHHWQHDRPPMLHLVHAMCAACAAEPALNAWFLDAQERVLRHEQVNLGLAVDTVDGLIVAVLQNAGRLDDHALILELERLKAGVTARTLPAAELRGATISLSNFGTIGGEHAALVVLPPQVAILGAGRIAERVVAQDGAVAVQRTLPLSLTFDHRVVTGAEAARFMAATIQELERPAQ